MKICLAQTRPFKGDIPANIDSHRRFIDLAVSAGAEMIVFPELSLTGYEPALAGELAIDREDGRFDVFQEISDGKAVTVIAGAPVKDAAGVFIGALVFRPERPRSLYAKQYLHTGEELAFVSGRTSSGMVSENPKVALAICYEMLVPEHAKNAAANGAGIYIASVANSAHGIAQAAERAAELADLYSMTVLMANCVGPAAGMACPGQSAVWNGRGQLVGQLDGENEGIIVFDTRTQELTRQKL